MPRICAVKISLVLLLTVVCTLTLATASNAEFDQIDASANIVYKLYKDYAWEAVFTDFDNAKGIFGKPIAFQSRSVLETYFDSDLTSLLLRDASCVSHSPGEECKLGFDPIFASQDPMASDMEIRQVTSDTVAVDYTYPSNGEKIEMIYKLRKTGIGWRIDNIIYRSQHNTALKDILHHGEIGR